jgi:hypothetical protein
VFNVGDRVVDAASCYLGPGTVHGFIPGEYDASKTDFCVRFDSHVYQGEYDGPDGGHWHRRRAEELKHV